MRSFLRSREYNLFTSKIGALKFFLFKCVKYALKIKIFKAILLYNYCLMALRVGTISELDHVTRTTSAPPFINFYFLNSIFSFLTINRKIRSLNH